MRFFIGRSERFSKTNCPNLLKRVSWRFRLASQRAPTTLLQKLSSKYSCDSSCRDLSALRRLGWRRFALGTQVHQGMVADTSLE